MTEACWTTAVKKEVTAMGVNGRGRLRKDSNSAVDAISERYEKSLAG